MIAGAQSTEALYPELKAYLAERKWYEKQCAKCNTPFYSKSPESNCGENKCTEGYAFLSRKPKKNLRITQARDHIDKHFGEQHYVKIKPRNLVSNGSSTLFATAGVQCVEEMIKGKEPVRSEQGYVLQPSFRTQTIDSINADTKDSCYAFVNVATIHPEASFQDHLRHFDDWITALSRIGYYAGDISLIPYDKTPDWGTGAFQKLGIRVSYHGLELGVANYCLHIPRGTESINLSDIGFGLERLVWGVGKREDLHDHLELDEHGLAVPKERYDLTRLMTLMAMSGLEPGNRGPGYRFRQAAKLFVEKGFGYNVIDKEANTAFNFWNSLTNKQSTPEDSIASINDELGRSYNLLLLNKMQLDNAPELLKLHPEELFRVLLDRGVQHSKLKSAVRGMHVPV